MAGRCAESYGESEFLFPNSLRERSEEGMESFTSAGRDVMAPKVMGGVAEVRQQKHEILSHIYSHSKVEKQNLDTVR